MIEREEVDAMARTAARANRRAPPPTRGWRGGASAREGRAERWARGATAGGAEGRVRSIAGANAREGDIANGGTRPRAKGVCEGRGEEPTIRRFAKSLSARGGRDDENGTRGCVSDASFSPEHSKHSPAPPRGFKRIGARGGPVSPPRGFEPRARRAARRGVFELSDARGALRETPPPTTGLVALLGRRRAFTERSRARSSSPARDPFALPPR